MSLLKLITALLALVVGVLAWEIHAQDLAASEQTKPVHELGSKWPDRATKSSLELQAKCARQAATAFTTSGLKGPFAGYVNHYSEKLDKCFVVMNETDSRSTPGSVFISKTLSDAFEGKTYGEFFLQRQVGTGKRQWIQCYVIQPSGDEKPCESQGQFDRLAEMYMT
jgi:hypothetical protein